MTAIQLSTTSDPSVRSQCVAGEPGGQSFDPGSSLLKPCPKIASSHRSGLDFAKFGPAGDDDGQYHIFPITGSDAETLNLLEHKGAE